MFEILMEHKLFSGSFLILLSLSIICQFITGVIYRRLIKETDNMSATNNKFLKQCKMKFANCYQMSGGVANIPVFVDKLLSRISILGISLRGIQHLAGQFMLLSVVAAGAGACSEIIEGETVGKVLPYYIVSFLGLYVYFSVSGIVDIQGKKENLKINLVDYLENHMANKLKQSAIDWEGLTGEKIMSGAADRSMQEDAVAAERAKTLREEIGLNAGRTEPAEEQKTTDVTGNEKVVFTQQEEQELEELLREFLA